MKRFPSLPQQTTSRTANELWTYWATEFFSSGMELVSTTESGGLPSRAIWRTRSAEMPTSAAISRNVRPAFTVDTMASS